MNWKIWAVIAASLVLLGLAFQIAGVPPLEALKELFVGSLGSASRRTGTLKEMTPLLVLGTAVFLALRAGLFNIGVEGQFIVGAAACSIVAIKLPGIPGLVLGTVLGILAGAVWAFPAGWIKAYRGGHEVITTIMLNNVALFLTGYLVAGPLKDPKVQSATTAYVAESSRLPGFRLFGMQVNIALLLGIALLIWLAFWLKRTVQGYELQAVGANPKAASMAGVSAPRTTTFAMTVSGAIAGFGGALQVLAYEGRFYDGFSPGYGFDSLGVALLAGGHPLAVLPSAFLFGVLQKGSSALQVMQVPKGISMIVLGLLIVVFAVVRYRKVAKVA